MKEEEKTIIIIRTSMEEETEREVKGIGEERKFTSWATEKTCYGP